MRSRELRSLMRRRPRAKTRRYRIARWFASSPDGSVVRKFASRTPVHGPYAHRKSRRRPNEPCTREKKIIIITTIDLSELYVVRSLAKSRSANREKVILNYLENPISKHRLLKPNSIASSNVASAPPIRIAAIGIKKKSLRFIEHGAIRRVNELALNAFSAPPPPPKGAFETNTIIFQIAVRTPLSV